MQKKDDAQWKKILTPEQFSVLREKATEAPFSGEYDTMAYLPMVCMPVRHVGKCYLIVVLNLTPNVAGRVFTMLGPVQ